MAGKEKQAVKVYSYGPWTRYNEVSHPHGQRGLPAGRRLDVTEYNDGSYSVEDHADTSKAVDPTGVVTTVPLTEPTKVTKPGLKKSTKAVTKKSTKAVTKKSDAKGD